MSHVALQRVMVRMLYDPQFTSRVLNRDPEALAGLDLTDHECAWLHAPDPRAWTTDAGRPARSLTVLLQQFPTSSFLVAHADGPQPLLNFFASTPFHENLQQRGSMALAFAEYLIAGATAGRFTDPRVGALAGFEAAIVELHRKVRPMAPEFLPEASTLALSPDKRLVVCRAGTADLHEAALGTLGATGSALAQAVLEASESPPQLELGEPGTEFVLLELVRDDGPRVKFLVGSSEITPEFYALLRFAESPRSRRALLGELVRLGADPDDAPEILEEFVDDGTLVGVAETQTQS